MKKVITFLLIWVLFARDEEMPYTRVLQNDDP